MNYKYFLLILYFPLATVKFILLELNSLVSFRRFIFYISIISSNKDGLSKSGKSARFSEVLNKLRLFEIIELFNLSSLLKGKG